MKIIHLIKVLSSLIVKFSDVQAKTSQIKFMNWYLREIISFTTQKMTLETGASLPSATEIHHNLENFTCDPLKNTMGSPILNVLICMGKYIRIQKVKEEENGHLLRLKWL